MYILMAEDICMEPEILKVVIFIKAVLNAIKVLVPVILIILGMLDFSKAMMAGDDTKMAEYRSKFMRRLYASVIIFFVPTIIDFAFRTIDNTNYLNDACWNSATNENLELVKAEAKTRREKEKEEYNKWMLYKQQTGNYNTSSNSTGSSSNHGNSNSSGNSITGSKKGIDIVNYAKQFIGNPYVWGGTSLTNGADCSGFTLKVYEHFGVTLPHSAAMQSTMGTSVPLDKLQAGDLLFYKGKNGQIGHVSIYAGDGTVVHASSAKTGIKTSLVGYRAAASARRYLD